MSTKTVYLSATPSKPIPVSGANCGISHGLATTLAAQPNTIVFSGARDLTAQSLKELSAKNPNVQLMAGDKAAAITDFQRIAGQLDLSIVCQMLSDGNQCRFFPRISNYYDSIATTPLSTFREHWEVNTFGTVVLFQAAYTLLLASSTGAPTFAFISSATSSMAWYMRLQVAAYASSKAAWVTTDMGNRGAVLNDLPQVPVSVEDSVADGWGHEGEEQWADLELQGKV
ncbi:hypothetical protein DFH07DRAFT_766576 [Mycena maculata]|uniref:NAD(P)-binding protein n=1 Tax=Mycena maculata TaxID=230809 RepID=A0AAD7K258_9AGAR|nr:hypothetical protein DFH07DRAFT_766576 [Mycena maculata]